MMLITCIPCSVNVSGQLVKAKVSLCCSMWESHGGFGAGTRILEGYPGLYRPPENREYS